MSTSTLGNFIWGVEGKDRSLHGPQHGANVDYQQLSQSHLHLKQLENMVHGILQLPLFQFCAPWAKSSENSKVQNDGNNVL